MLLVSIYLDIANINTPIVVEPDINFQQHFALLRRNAAVVSSVLFPEKIHYERKTWIFCLAYVELFCFCLCVPLCELCCLHC